MEKGGRNAGIDLIKVLAVLFVISIHTIGNLHVLAMDMQGVRAFVIVVFRYFVMSSVPLFLMITGYLQAHKTPCKRYFLGLVPVVLSYLFIAACGAVYNMQMDASITWDVALVSIFDFTANNYAWYVEMFIGLYLLIPFLNGGYEYLGERKKKFWLLAILVFITIAPSIMSIFRTPERAFEIIPNHWIEFYPVCYYMIGVYIREYRPRMNLFVSLGCALASAVIPTILVFIASDGGAYVDWILNGFYSVSSMLTALFVFLAFYDKEIKSRPVCFALKAVAVSSLDIYLFSNLVEKLVYPYLGMFPLKLPATIVIVFGLSLVAAKGKQFLFYLVKRAFGALRPKGASQ